MDIPEHLPGEPALPQWSLLATAGELARKLLWIALTLTIALPLCALYLPLRLWKGRPPVVLEGRRAGRLLRRALLTPLPTPGLRPAARLALALSVVQQAALGPLFGLAWLIDELRFGAALDATPIRQPLFELSAARSGSTQLAHYIEDDPAICAPSALFTVLPYLWLWRLLGPAQVDALAARFLARFPVEFLERHEMDPLRTDTFEVLCMQFQGGHIAACLGPDFVQAEFGTARLTPANAAWWQGEQLRLIDRIARKTLLRHPGRRLLLKGHFLALARDLQSAYPDARFLVVLRAPAPRIASLINFHRCHPVEPLVGKIPWPYLVTLGTQMEVDYNAAEAAWLAEPGRRCVVPFTDYVADLPGTLAKVYADCLDQHALPPHLPTVHAPRTRHSYRIDRSLSALGVDPLALRPGA